MPDDESENLPVGLFCRSPLARLRLSAERAFLRPHPESMTENAVSMFGVEIFEKATGNPVYRQLIPKSFNFREVLKNKKVEHISLAKSLDLLVIAPASANILAKIANGLADDYLSTLVLSVTCPVIVAPSMNTNMWNNRTTQQNQKKLNEMGYFLINPDSGRLACGYQGVGRLKNISELQNFILKKLSKSGQLKGLKVLLTAGATSVPVDSVRVITNKASGKMGKFLAQECFKRGAEVLLLRAENSVRPEFNIPEKTFFSVSELDTLLTKYVPDYDIIFHSAAVSDFYLENEIPDKMKSHKTYILTLKPVEKLIAKIKKYNPGITLVGFKAEIGIDPKRIKFLGRRIMSDNQADYVIINDVGRKDIGFGSDYNEVYLLSSSGKLVKFRKQTKQIIAGQIIDAIFPGQGNVIKP